MSLGEIREVLGGPLPGVSPVAQQETRGVGGRFQSDPGTPTPLIPSMVQGSTPHAKRRRR